MKQAVPAAAYARLIGCQGSTGALYHQWNTPMAGDVGHDTLQARLYALLICSSVSTCAVHSPSRGRPASAARKCRIAARTHKGRTVIALEGGRGGETSRKRALGCA